MMVSIWANRGSNMFGVSNNLHLTELFTILQDPCPQRVTFLGAIMNPAAFAQKNREFKLKYLKKLFDTNTILCLQEVHGKDEYLQAIQVLAPRFRFFGTFTSENEDAGGSAVCIHRDILSEEAIVTHLVTCHGRDHLVNIQSGRHNLVIVNVHFEPELSLRQLRHRLHLIRLHIPMKWALFWVTSTSAILKKDDLMCGTRHSPMVKRERLPCFTPFFHTSLRLLNLITREWTAQNLG